MTSKQKMTRQVAMRKWQAAEEWQAVDAYLAEVDAHEAALEYVQEHGLASSDTAAFDDSEYFNLWRD